MLPSSTQKAQKQDLVLGRGMMTDIATMEYSINSLDFANLILYSSYTFIVGLLQQLGISVKGKKSL